MILVVYFCTNNTSQSTSTSTGTSHVIFEAGKSIHTKYSVMYITSMYLYNYVLQIYLSTPLTYRIQLITKHTPELSPSPPAASIAGFAAYR